MRQHKVGLLVFFFLIYLVSFAFASLTMILPIERNPNAFNYPESISAGKQLGKALNVEAASSASDLNYQAWRRIQTSA